MIGTKEYMHYLNECPNCYLQESMRVVFSGGQYFTDERTVMCLNCGLVFINPRLANVKEFYGSDEYSSLIREGDTPSEHIIKRTEALAGYRIDLLKDHLPDSGTHLEIGSGSGYLAKAIQDETDLRVVAIEPSPGFANWSREEHGIEVMVEEFPCDLDHIEDIQSVSLIHVLEHFSNPFWILDHISHMLPTGGIFVLEYPDLMQALERQKVEDGLFEPRTYFQKSHLFDFYFGVLAPELMMRKFQINKIYIFDTFPIDKNVLIIMTKLDEIPTMEDDAWLTKEQIQGAFDYVRDSVEPIQTAVPE